MKSVLIRLMASAAILPLFSIDALSQAPAPQSESPQTVSGAIDLLPEIRVVRFRENPSAQARYGLAAAELAGAFPEVVSAGQGFDSEQLTAILFAVAKDLRDDNVQLGEQLQHMMSEKAELERKLHALEARLTEVSSKVDVLDAAARTRESRSSARQ